MALACNTQLVSRVDAGIVFLLLSKGIEMKYSNFLQMGGVLAAVAFMGLLAGCDQGPNKEPMTQSKVVPIPNLQVSDWGPKEIKVGVPANPQPDGVSAIWIGVKGVTNDPKTVIKYADKTIVPAAVQPELVTAPVPKEIIDNAGEYSVVIEEPSGRHTMVGTLKVTP